MVIYRPPLPQPYVFILIMNKVIYESSSKPFPTPENDTDFSFSRLGARVIKSSVHFKWFMTLNDGIIFYSNLFCLFGWLNIAFDFCQDLLTDDVPYLIKLRFVRIDPNHLFIVRSGCNRQASNMLCISLQSLNPPGETSSRCTGSHLWTNRHLMRWKICHSGYVRVHFTSMSF